MKVKLSDLAKMPEVERNETLDKLVQLSRRKYNGELDAELAAYETKYGISSDAVSKAIASGALPETSDTIRWTMLARACKLMDRLEQPPLLCEDDGDENV